ncbi:hypothetical protein [Photorhabdus temperata]|uniref:hypothetical protein n=1 Tax=Photorhabdus temperata TaxID=574560 RepID=UPI000406ADDB|nr:hypothetical protein [Photorhabdus temperata]
MKQVGLRQVQLMVMGFPMVNPSAARQLNNPSGLPTPEEKSQRIVIAVWSFLAVL